MADKQIVSMGRVVFFTAFRGNEQKETDQYAAFVTRAYTEKDKAELAQHGVIFDADKQYVDLATFGSSSLYFQQRVAFDADGAASTWRWPPRV